MKYLILTLILFIFSSHCLAQSKTMDVESWILDDSNELLRLHNTAFASDGQANLLRSNESLHFRLSDGFQDIDIWTNDYKTFYGSILNEISTCTDSDETKSILYYNRRYVDTAMARKVYALFIKYKIFDIPRRQEIKGWSWGCDGNTYTIEYSTSTHYSKKSYWSPSLFAENIKEAATIDTLIKQLETSLSLEKCSDEFRDNLPHRCYNYGMVKLVTFESIDLGTVARNHRLISTPGFLYAHKRQKKKLCGYYIGRFSIRAKFTIALQLNKDSTFKYRRSGDGSIEKAQGRYRFWNDTLYFSYAGDISNIYKPLDTNMHIMMVDTNDNIIKIPPRRKIKDEIAARPKKMLYRYGRLWALDNNGLVSLWKFNYEWHRKRYYLKRVKGHKWQDWE